jgi:DNA repair ATPase RecN
VHHTVVKDVRKSRTATRISALVGDARVDEIARMSGGQLTDAARAHARELLSLRGGSRRRAG